MTAPHPHICCCESQCPAESKYKPEIHEFGTDVQSSDVANHSTKKVFDIFGAVNAVIRAIRELPILFLTVFDMQKQHTVNVGESIACTIIAMTLIMPDSSVNAVLPGISIDIRIGKG